MDTRPMVPERSSTKVHLPALLPSFVKISRPMVCQLYQYMVCHHSTPDQEIYYLIRSPGNFTSIWAANFISLSKSCTQDTVLLFVRAPTVSPFPVCRPSKRSMVSTDLSKKATFIHLVATYTLRKKMSSPPEPTSLIAKRDAKSSAQPFQPAKWQAMNRPSRKMFLLLSHNLKKLYHRLKTIPL